MNYCSKCESNHESKDCPKCGPLASSEFYPISEKALAEAGNIKGEVNRYPFDDLQVNQSFTTPIAKAKLLSMKSVASRKSKNGKRFVVVIHEDLGIIECARVA